jgi:hypothetical protein
VSAAGVADLLDLAALGALTVLCLVALANAAWAPRLHRGEGRAPDTSVSVLVPARDEAHHLHRTLPALVEQDHPRLEILVLDDGSTDATAAVTAAAARASGGRLRLLTGTPLPPGWTGKNWACHQLAATATGDVLLFCDADVRAGPDAVRLTLAAMERYGAGAATALPRLVARNRAEAAVAPLVAQLPVLAALPLRLVPALPSPALSMGNGQWLAFTRSAYAAAGGHAAVADRVLEDVALARRVKAAGERLVALLAPETLEVRMYDGWPAVRAGFRKNLYPLLGGRPLPFLLGVAGFLLVAVYPLLAVFRGTPAGVAAFVLLVALRVLGVGVLRHGWRSVALHPLGAVLAAGIAVDSAVAAARGTARWKDRRVGTRLPG